MKFRNIVMALLSHGDQVLVMKRASHKEIGPNSWSGLAGHMEDWELGDPYSACFREIEEESGIRKEDLEELSLGYIIYNRMKEEVIVNHLFFGKVNKKETRASDEGQLYWVDKKELVEMMGIPGINKAMKDYYDQPFKGTRLALIRDQEPYIHFLDEF